MASTQSTPIDRPLRDKKLATQSRANGDAELAQRFAGHLKSITGVTVPIIIQPLNTQPRATPDTKRIADRRAGV